MQSAETVEKRLEQIERILARIESETLEFKKIKIMLDRYMESERRYRSLYEKSPEMYRSINTQGIIIDCNESYAKNLGYAKQEVIGSSIYDHIADTDLNAMRESFEIWLEKGLVENREIWFKRKDGSVFPTLVSATSFHDEAGQLIGSNSLIRDISDIHRDRQKIKHSETKVTNMNEQLKNSKTEISTFKRYRDMYEQVPDLLRTIDLEGKIIDCNETYAKNLGYTKEEAIGMSIFDHTAERSMDILQSSFKEWLSTGHDMNKVIWCKRKDKSEFKTLMSIINLYDDGVIVGRLASLRILDEHGQRNREGYDVEADPRLLDLF